MERSFRPFRTGTDADLAFAVMVLAAYFTTFSTMPSVSTEVLLWMIGLGVAYIAIGIYGYAVAAHTGRIGYYLTYFAIQLFLGGIIVYLGKGVGFNAMVLLPLAGHSVMLMPGNWRVVINLAIVMTYLVAMNIFSPTSWAVIWSSVPMFLAGQIFIVVFTQMAVNEEQARSEVEQLVKELEAANHRLREYAMQAEELAITRERNRLAREIHDGLGHYLTTIFMQIQAARAVMKNDPQKAQAAMTTAQQQTQEALVDVRRSVASLRDMPVDSLSLPGEIDKMLKGCEGTGIAQEIKILGSPRVLTVPVFTTIYRAAQEAINNTLKHANAQHLSIILDYTQSDLVRIMVQDDGQGAEEVNGGFGLLGMRERIHMLNGKLSVVTSPGNGFCLEVLVPG